LQCCSDSDGKGGMPFDPTAGINPKDDSKIQVCCQKSSGKAFVYNPYSECCECPPPNDPNPFHPAKYCYWNPSSGTRNTCNRCPNGQSECITGTHGQGMPEITCYDPSTKCCQPSNTPGISFLVNKEGSVCPAYCNCGPAGTTCEGWKKVSSCNNLIYEPGHCGGTTTSSTLDTYCRAWDQSQCTTTETQIGAGLAGGQCQWVNDKKCACS
jgi:hypothetical protein